ncbi:hypothetical protein BJ508DRAFT_73463 [Ascobolus immersus RN42]|uniref:Uncharacterized protein n=1 Tax=Ascobolus immersus RN42 TaxID=1160509 RepID=A0A3N4HIE5_ASCIM|nr:hypothetical protein BJ508DRAFT_73463 [Ascobolus immersus RN42]
MGCGQSKYKSKGKYVSRSRELDATDGDTARPARSGKGTDYSSNLDKSLKSPASASRSAPHARTASTVTSSNHLLRPTSNTNSRSNPTSSIESRGAKQISEDTHTSHSSPSTTLERQPSLLRRASAPQDDVSITRAFTSSYRTVLDHSIEFYSAPGWKSLKNRGRETFQKYVPETERLLGNAEHVKWVILSVISGVVWDWIDGGALFQESKATGGSGKGGPRKGRNASKWSSRTSTDRMKFIRILEVEPNKILARKRAGLELLVSQLKELLRSFTTGKNEELRSRSLETLISGIIDLSILLEAQRGEWSYQVLRSIGSNRAFDNSNMESVDGTATGGAVQAVCWPVLEKGSEGAVDRAAGGSRHILVKMKVLLS